MSSTMMQCPDSGRWRAWLDNTGNDHPALAQHLSGCGDCRQDLERVRADAGVATAALASLDPERMPAAEQISAAHARALARHRSADERSHSGVVAKGSPVVRSASSMLRTRSAALGGLAAAVALTFVVSFTEQGQAAAAQFLSQFRSQKFAVVTVSPARGQTGGFAQLDRLGTVTLPASGKSAEKVASLAEASQRVGFAVKQPDAARLPQAVSKDPEISVIEGGQVRFTIDTGKAREYFKSIGRSDVTVPDRFDGATLVVSVPNAVLLNYAGSGQAGSGTANAKQVGSRGLSGGTSKSPAGGSSSGSIPSMLMIGQASELTAEVEGKVSLDELREFLLSLPGWSPDTVRQLRAIKDWQSTLPIFVPVEGVQWKDTTIAGAQGLIFSDGSGLGSATVWQRDGRVYGVAGTVNEQDVKHIAESLR